MNKLKTALAKMMNRDENYELRKAIEKINRRAIETSTAAFRKRLAYVNVHALRLGR